MVLALKVFATTLDVCGDAGVPYVIVPFKIDTGATATCLPLSQRAAIQPRRTGRELFTFASGASEERDHGPFLAL